MESQYRAVITADKLSPHLLTPFRLSIHLYEVAQNRKGNKGLGGKSTVAFRVRGNALSGATNLDGNMKWKLKRTRQCSKCPWRKDVNPHDIPNGYSEEKHCALKSTIARPGDLSSITSESVRVMACHEAHDDYCVGWLANQIGPGNNIGMRIKMLSCENGRLHLLGEQHETFEETLP